MQTVHSTEPRRPARACSERGIALMTTMMVMLMLSSLLIGFAVMVGSDNQLASMDVGDTEAFYLAQAGLEKMTADLGAVFEGDPSPTGAEVRAVGDNPPSLPDVAFVAPDGGDGYTITFPTTTGNPATGDPLTELRTVSNGPFQGLTALVTPFQLEVTARKTDRSESTLRRTFQTVSVPLWEFGLYSELDLLFFPTDDFTLTGRVHTNQNLYAIANDGPLQFADRVSAVGEVVRQELPNGYPQGNKGIVKMTTAPGVYRALDDDEGSVIDDPSSDPNEPLWTNLSTGAYNSRLVNGRTGAQALALGITGVAGEPIDLIRRPPPGEPTTSALFDARHFSQASMRILLSDAAVDLTSLPSVNITPPVNLDAPIPGYIGPPLALSKDGINPGAGFDEGYRMPLDTPLVGGFLKIEIQTAVDAWQDVTLEILNLGIAGRSIDGPCAATDPNPDAVIRLQRVRDDANVSAPFAPCGVGSTDPYDYWPNTLYDTREGSYRDNQGDHDHFQFLGGNMHYVELDVDNLRRYLEGSIGANGLNVMQIGTDNGYLVYFSDRRSNRNAAGDETGEYGFEDVVNWGAAGVPNAVNDLGEDVNSSGTLDLYGQFPVFPPGVGVGAAPLDATARPWTSVGREFAASQDYLSRANPQLFFRRALKLVDGSLGNLPTPGLTVTSENPLYIEGDYNASTGFGGAHAAAAIIADAITLLSNDWTDWDSIDHPHQPSRRDATDTWYRMAIGTGSALHFPQISGNPLAFGTDGGVRHKMRTLEDWNSADLNYVGSLAVLFTSRQATGTFKCCDNVFEEPKGWNITHDADFLNPALLPPATPFLLTDVTITGFTQVIRSGS